MDHETNTVLGLLIWAVFTTWVGALLGFETPAESAAYLGYGIIAPPLAFWALLVARKKILHARQERLMCAARPVRDAFVVEVREAASKYFEGRDLPEGWRANVRIVRDRKSERISIWVRAMVGQGDWFEAGVGLPDHDENVLGSIIMRALYRFDIPEQIGTIKNLLDLFHEIDPLGVDVYEKPSGPVR